ncbi:thioredoxin family protein [Nisaea acidiphila]|uniref:Thioredoxin family protein n=1 Tax=Nisaea acidiphila TaxID=1862145 RepID=A0A9J7AXL2_9PROT|nr:thioredoxin family protein [Nisaea acidiphila]UUX51546.1 thioredoxin family protein [Nisaea acidiphila]
MMRMFVGLFAVLLFGQTALAEVGEDGLHKKEWFTVTFKDVAEDIQDAKSQGKRLAMIFEQRGCIYCRQLHEGPLSDPEVAEFIKSNFVVIQYNLFGDEEVTDFDGTALPEKEMAKRWGVVFTPTILFMPEKVPEGDNAGRASVATMPGAFGKGTTLDMFTWVKEKGYESDEHFQKYHARRIQERQKSQ